MSSRTFYRAVDTASPDPLQTPQHFALRIASFRAIAGAENPIHVALLHAVEEEKAHPGAPNWSYKARVEFAYEVTRLTISPDLASRLVSLYAFVDVDDAVAFAQENGKAAVFECHLENPGSRVSIHDFGLYYVRHEDLACTAAGFSEAWSAACESARSYWQPGASMQRAEALIVGNLCLASSAVWETPAG